MSNLLKRTVFGALYVGVIAVSILLVPAVLPYLAVFAMGAMMHEFYGISLGNEMKAQRLLAIASPAILVILAGSGLAGTKWMWISLLPLTAIVPVQLCGKEPFKLERLAWVFYGLVWIALPFVLYPYIFLHNGEYHGHLLMSFFILIWCSDIGAYCLGSLLGQRPGAKKLAPSISPHKSWWGVFGGIILSIAAAIGLMSAGWLELPFVHTAVLGLIIAAASIIGDLFESLWKRNAGIKDSGNMIPGHGGMLDRLDSSLFAIPLGAVYLILFNLI